MTLCALEARLHVMRHFPIHYMFIWMMLLPSLACTAEPLAPTDEELGLPLRSVVQREADVFASTIAGLYRAELATQRWEQLAMPAEMPPGGSFGDMPEDSEVLLYFASHLNTHEAIGRDKRYRYGLYLSKDDGQTWDLISEHSSYGPVLLHPNGSIFVVTDQLGRQREGRLLLSKDIGRTWRDISDGLFGQIGHIFPDPDHPDLICVNVNSIRDYILQAEDDRFEWQATREWDWKPERFETTELFHPRYWGSPNYMLHASLENYFEHDFGNRVHLPAIDLAPDQARFEFEEGEAIVVPVTIRFLRNDAVTEYYRRQWEQQRDEGLEHREWTPAVVELVDHADVVDLWGIRVEHNGQRIARTTPALAAVTESDNPKATRQELRERTRWRTIRLRPHESYRRTLDLGTLFDFSGPGEYRVQLSYSGQQVADWEAGQWAGWTTSPVFELVVSPARP
jgi:hypothetical protein